MNNSRKMNISRKLVKVIIGTLFLLLANILFIGMYQMNILFANVDFAEIIFNLKMPLAGAQTNSIFAAFSQCKYIIIFLTVIGLIPAIKSDSVHCLVLHIWKKSFSIPLNLWERYYLPFTSFLLVAAITYGAVSLDVPSYITSRLHHSNLYEKYYVNPSTAEITFPKKKRNLIYIFMESMEDSYMSKDVGGAKSSNLIPEMTELQLKNTNFSASGKINGGLAENYCNWTMAAIVAQTAGVPLAVPVDASNTMNQYNAFLPGAYSIGEILKKQGYRQIFLLGSDAEFGARKEYMLQHGNYEIEDYYYAINQKWIAPDYHVWWGYEDEKLYSNAKKELKRLAKSDQPFNLTMLTVDTHFTGGYYCSLCKNKYQDQYSNVIACASRQVTDFISWVQQQPFYENTTIVISGDHPTMDSEYMKDVPESYARKVYTAVINSACDYKLDYDRKFTTLDMFPTTLASLGAKIKGNRLALGTNLFADKATLAEELGSKLDEKISLNSRYYNNHILYAK